MRQTRFFRVFSVVLVLALLCSVLPPARADFSVDAAAAAVMEIESGIMLYQQDADVRVYPASLTKVMTALVAIENCSLDEMIPVRAATLEGLHPDSTTANLADGEVLSLRDLLYTMFLVSANDACLVVAEHIAGSVDAFVQMMNDKAAELGCTGTHFVNPHGLHDENHYTTARDLLRMAAAFYRSQTLMDIASTEYYDIPATDHNNRHELYTIIYTGSTLITPAYYYEGCRGIKTGSTSAAGRCLLTFCERDGLKVLAVVTGCPTYVSHNGSDWAGHFAAMHDLLDYTYANFTMPILREVYAGEIAARAGTWEPQPDPVIPAQPAQPDDTPSPSDEDVPAVPDDTQPDGDVTSDAVPGSEPDSTQPADTQPAAPDDTLSPAAPATPEQPRAETPDGQAGGLRWYGWLLIGIATVLVLYAMGYLIHNFTRPLRRRRRSQRL